MDATNHTQNSKRSYTISDYRLEIPDFQIEQVQEGGRIQYRVSGDLCAEAPLLRESKYLTKERCLEIYRWMLFHRRMEVTLENLYKQGQVVGGVYFGLGQEACACASACALRPDDWIGPLIRDQGAILIRGFQPADIMMQYMARSGSPTKGRDANSHFGDIETRNIVAPISTLGDVIPVITGVALGARMQGKNIAVLTYIGDGGQSTGVTYEGINFAAVQKLGLVVIVENNVWAYSTPTVKQFACKDLVERAIGYGIPGVIVDGTDACQVYDAAYEACERARRGEGPTLIEAKLMRMKGHAIHDAATYVPRELLDYWTRRDPIARFANYLVQTKKWITAEENEKIVADVEFEMEKNREVAMDSPMPDPETALGGVYCDSSCHPINPKYGSPVFRTKTQERTGPGKTESAVHLK